MTAKTISASDLYAQIATAFVSDPDLESNLLADFEGAVSQRFGVKLPKPATLVRAQDGYCLTYDGQSYDLGDPRNAKPGELNDAELELVSAGADWDCPEHVGSGRPKQDLPKLSSNTGHESIY